MGPLKFILKWGFFFSIWIAIFGIIALFYYFQGLPSLGDLEREGNKQLVQIDYSNENLITNRGGVYISEVAYYELPQNLINAVIATEDRRFFSHHGVDLFGIARAFSANKQAGRIVQGGSTITQQLAKMLFLSSDRNFKRKIQEILLAFQLERQFSKEQILAFYLNRAYFGSGNNGVASAAKFYFGKDVSQLNLNESAMLAGILKAPTKYSPKNNRKAAEIRAGIVLKAMIDAGFLNEENLAELDSDANYTAYHAQRFYFSDFVYGQFPEFLESKVDDEKLIKITTTMDEKIQKNLEDVLDEFTQKNSKKLGKSQISVVIMKPDGAVLGMSGGNDYQQSQFNRAVFSKRQVGSAFKTFVYLAAFEKDLKVDDVYEDRPVNIGTWLPENYENRYMGSVTVKRAFADSLNSVAVQIARKVGSEAIIQMAHKCGIISEIKRNDSTIALGTSEVSLYEMTAAYATIANEGVPVIPYTILEIKNNDDVALYKRQSSGFEPVISKGAIQDIKEVMHEVVSRGTGKNVKTARDVYGKTGTSQNFRDAWFVGFDDRYVIGVWIGNDDNSSTDKITGGSLPAQLFGKIMEAI
jgi:penicillin-binding protein 1A